MVDEMVTNDSTMTMFGDDKPCFFKIIFDGHAEALRIPPCFMKHLSKEELDIAVLKGPSGSHWRIKLRKKVDGLFLQDGWPEFLRDHSLGNHELILLTYEGNMHFSIQIFDGSGLERIDESITCKHQETTASSSNQQKRGRPSKNAAGPLNLHPQKPCNFSSANEGRDAIWERVASFTSSLPYFKCCLKESNVQKRFFLRIPKFFSQMHLPADHLKTKFVLRNEQGIVWMVNVIPVGGSYSVSGGWRAFVVDNKLKQDDTCIFELVDKHDMRVHIFRAVDEFECTGAGTIV
ncbi:unnamed protein product [Ilex paraguariensis]|uniref:TF-B3 domain-containing protein n=1 Tax=Ilex paraguariensis TaxID=185542 RepID=A0ABC8S1T9_9AQUA